MQTKVFQVVQNKYGFVLLDSSKNEKFVLYRSKNASGRSPFYLKRVEPTEHFISGMYYTERSNIYNGRTTQGVIIKVRIVGDVAEVWYRV